ncbi:MAG: Kazal-type serine protease inhibitor family protein, partial [Phycisphaerales bacterium]|nr:Kazal-type serine protease inhibitor family protein [Phycisphaerales bacterium]
QPVRGTLKFVYVGQIDGIETYNVEDVNWTVPFFESRRIIGSGKYEIGSPGMITVLEQRMQLALQVDGGPIERFDSGWVHHASDIAGSVNITVSMNGMYCWDRAIVVDAKRVPPQDIQRYHLSPGSTYEFGCFGICDCYIGDLRPMTGDFTLVRLDENPLFREFAVVDVRWLALAPSNTETATLTGVGFYRIGGEFAVQQQMLLDLLVMRGGTSELTHFDSGLVVGGGAFPHIDVVVPQVNLYNICAGILLHVVGDPANAEVCGGIAGIPCPEGKFCKLPVGECCCDFFGVCAPIPGPCPEYADPVCGCDGVTYDNPCFADAAAVSIAHFGRCESACRPADNGQDCMPAPCSAIPEVKCLG